MLAFGAAIAAGITLLTGLAAVQFRRDYREFMASHEQRAGDLVGTLAGHVEVEFRAIDAALTAIADAVRRDPSWLLGAESADARLQRHVSVANPAVALGVTDAAGVVLAMSSGLPRDRTVSLADRPQFQHHRDNPDDALHISQPYLSRPSGLRIFTLSRRLSTSDGAFLGIVAATIQGERIFDVFARLERARTHRLVIARADGIVLGCSPFCAIGADISDRPMFRRMAAGETRGVTRGVAPVDGKQVISAFQKVVGVPIVAISAINEEELSGRWWEHAWEHLAINTAGILLAMSLALLQLRTLRRRLMAEQALRVSSENLLRTGIEALHSGFAVFDREGRLRIWNRRMAEVFPHLASELREGRKMRELAVHAVGHRRPRLSAARAERLADRLLRRGAGPGAPRRWLERDGRVIEASDHATDDDMTVLLFRDVTEQERHAQTLRRALVNEREHNAQQQRFVAIVSHEFRTPLSIIDSSAQMLANGLPSGSPEGLHKRVGRIRDGVRQLVQLIDRILSSTRLAEGRIERQDESFDIVALVRSVCEQHGQVNKAFAIRLTCDAAGLEVVGDPRLVEHAVSNLVSNATKYSGQARSIDLALRPVADMVEITVRDYGIGIPADELPGIFKRFYRASTAKGIRGTGLGLNFTRELVAMHGGTIAVESTLGAGSTFTMRLPLVAKTPAQRRTAA